MKKYFIFFGLMIGIGFRSVCQDIVMSASRFVSLLDSTQRRVAIYPFDTEERYLFHYFPVNDRKGIALDQMNKDQRAAAFDLIRSCLSDLGASQAADIMKMEILLKNLENRKADDHFRDPEKYFFTIFGLPANNNIWGWRVDGHHVCFSFYMQDKKLVSGTPGFLGSNPAVVQDGPEKGKEILKPEKELAFALLHSLSADQLKKAIFQKDAPGDIITRVDRKAMIEHPLGLPYSEMNASQQQLFLNLLSVYIHRYTKLFADDMLKEIQGAGLNNLLFAWAGSMEPGIGHPHYYRIQGPTLIIEYDNTQNNANHVHTVVRDLKFDFGGDLLLEHYKAAH